MTGALKDVRLGGCHTKLRTRHAAGLGFYIKQQRAHTSSRTFSLHGSLEEKIILRIFTDKIALNVFESKQDVFT